ncbi:hypothetical protein M413DRAFT_437901 [Hebeloma cylindrosporum]|uniref:DUF3074 domain-containing protein n=1 Tax=Hebeloma cylindrosporum TaxID=76867 RepID=A0A0C2YG82_HEBCY|nr:hypothetical protein M413DRAFT_437901 [Hebeloma cylindrosporum h7]
MTAQSANPTPLLTITPLKPSEIPSEETIIFEGKVLIDSTASWKAGKTFFDVVKTSSRGKLEGDGAPWHCRISVHSPTDITFDQLWDKLSRNKAENELQFIHEIQKVNKIKELSSTSTIWTMYYTFMPPVSPRVFTVLQVTHLSQTTPRTGLIVSLSIDLTSEGDEELCRLEEKGTKGRYVSVERVMELENGNIEWRMATSSTPGGSIPSFIVESTMPKKIASVRTFPLNSFSRSSFSNLF